MFHHQSLLYVSLLLTGVSPTPQTYFQTGNVGGGTFTSVTFGSGAGVRTHQVQHGGGGHAVHEATHAVHATHGVHATHAVQTSYGVHPHARAGPLNHGEKCDLVQVDLEAEVCVPTLESSCEQEVGGKALDLFVKEYCHEVVRTYCTERTQVQDIEVCAYSYRLKDTTAEAKLVEAHWEHVCHQESICVTPALPSYGYKPSCHEEIRETCVLEPTLVDVVRPVSVQLPQPVEVCISKQIIIPDIECHQVRDKQCMPVAFTEEVAEFQINKCTVSPGEQLCQDTVVSLPSQVCLEKVQRVEVTYTQ